jgi:F-type H+-transporting ATPase subunit b
MNRYIYFAVATLIFAAVSLFVGTPQMVSAGEAGEHVDKHVTETAEHGKEHKIPSLNPLEVASDTAVWTLVIFLLVFGILGKFAFKPIAKALDEREKGIADKIANAQQLHDEAVNLLKQYQEKLDDSKEEVRQIFDTARKDAQRVANDIVEKARGVARLEQDRAMKEIDGATILALQTIAERSAALAINLAGKMICAEIRPEHHRNLIQTALEDFTKS